MVNLRLTIFFWLKSNAATRLPMEIVNPFHNRHHLNVRIQHVSNTVHSWDDYGGLQPLTCPAFQATETEDYRTISGG